MDDALFLAFCAIVLLISGGLISAKYGALGLPVVAVAILAVAGSLYSAKKQKS